jgi:hypothetical protein
MSISDLDAYRRRARPDQASVEAAEERIRTMQLDVLLEMAIATATPTIQLLEELSEQQINGEPWSQSDRDLLSALAAELHLMCATIAEMPESSPPPGAAA